MKIIAVTGGIASGKTTAANILAQKYNIPIIDSDHIAKDILQNNSFVVNQVITKFGKSITSSESIIDRRKLRDVVFTNSDNKQWLESLLHPIINKEIISQITHLQTEAKYNYCLVLIPLVTRKYLNNNEFIDLVLVIDAEPEHQISRGVKRDGQTQANIQNIIDSQIDPKERLKLADYVVYNNGQLEDLETELDKFYSKLLLAT